MLFKIKHAQQNKSYIFSLSRSMLSDFSIIDKHHKTNIPETELSYPITAILAAALDISDNIIIINWQGKVVEHNETNIRDTVD